METVATILLTLFGWGVTILAAGFLFGFGFWASYVLAQRWWGK